MNQSTQAVVATQSAANVGIGGVFAMILILGAIFYMSASEPKPK